MLTWRKEEDEIVFKMKSATDLYRHSKIQQKINCTLPIHWRNRPDVIEKRVEYANWFMANGVLNHCVFIDECGYNIWTARTHGRARVGDKSLPSGLWSARSKRNGNYGYISSGWTGVPLCMCKLGG